MDLGLKDRAVFVAGSSRGIGKGIASAFLREGACVAVTGRNAADLDRTREELAAAFGADRVLALAGDLTDPASASLAIQATIERWGRLDCLVANVGSGRSVPGWEPGRDSWDASFGINLWPSVHAATEALKHMIPAGKGSLVFVASITAVEATAAPLPYSAAKAALVNYAGNLARLVAKHGVRVNCVAPGNVLFEGGSWERHLEQRRDEILRMIAAEVPQNRFGTVEEIADVVVFLASDRASFVTGACWTADGGQTRSF